MKKFHLQAQVPIVDLAEVAEAMHKKGLRLIKPPDIMRFCLHAAHSILNAEYMTEDEAFKFLQNAGYFSLRESQQMEVVIAKATKKQKAMEELDDIIEQVKRSPSSTEDIKNMLSQPMKGVEE